MLAAQAAALDAQHAELIAHLAAAVPYRGRLDGIAAFSDPDRVTAHTAASRAAAEMSQAYSAFSSMRTRRSSRRVRGS